MLRQVYNRFRCLWLRRRKDAELDEEIRFHLTEETEERIETGLSPEQARTAARRDFGNITLTRELTREAWGWAPAERLLKDIASAFRMMRRNAGYTCAVVLTMALGIGLNAAMYDLLSRLFLQAPPHIEDPEGIHRIWVRERSDAVDRGIFTGPSAARDRMDWAEFNSLRDDPDRFSAVAGYTAPARMQNGRGQSRGGATGFLGDRRVLRAPGGSTRARQAAPTRRRRSGGDTGRGDQRCLLAATVRAFTGSPRSKTQLQRRHIRHRRRRAARFRRARPQRGPRSGCPLQVAATAIRGDSWRQSRTGFSLTALARLAPGVRPEPAAAAATAAVRAARATSRDAGDAGPRADRDAGPITAKPRTLRVAGSDAPAPGRGRRSPGRAPDRDGQHVEPADAAGRGPSTGACRSQCTRRGEMGRGTPAGCRVRRALRCLGRSGAGRGCARRPLSAGHALAGLSMGSRAIGRHRDRLPPPPPYSSSASGQPWRPPCMQRGAAASRSSTVREAPVLHSECRSVPV